MSTTTPTLPSRDRAAPDELTATSRYIILTAAFLGWMFSGFQMAVMTLTARSATTEFLRSGQLSATQMLHVNRLFVAPKIGGEPQPPISGEAESLKTIVPRWFSWYNAAFLFGAAYGGFVFGWLGDRLGRVRSMGASIFCFSLFSGLGYFAATPEQLLLSRFLAAMGVGGMWPTGVSLASEAWSEASRPLVAGMLGTSANVGLVTLNGMGYVYNVGPDSWRWTLLVCAAPIFLAFVVWFCVPESQRCLAARKVGKSQT